MARGWRGDLRTVRVLRYAVGVTLATSLSFALAWPLFVLTPVLVAFMLALPLPAPTLRQGATQVLHLLAAFLLGVLFTLLALPYPLLYATALAVALFHVYYLANRGGSPFLVLMSLLALLILPMTAFGHEALAIGFARYFVVSGIAALLLVWLAHGLLPDPVASPRLPAQPLQRGYSPVAARLALKSTVAVLPLVLLFLAFNLSGQLLVMVFAAIFSLSPDLTSGWQAARASLISTLIGGAGALLFYQLLVAVPELNFLALATLLTSLLIGGTIFSDRPIAKYLPSAMIALLVLIGSVMGEGAGLLDKLVTRVVLLSAAALYLVLSMLLLERVLPKRWFAAR